MQAGELGEAAGHAAQPALDQHVIQPQLLQRRELQPCHLPAIRAVLAQGRAQPQASQAREVGGGELRQQRGRALRIQLRQVQAAQLRPQQRLQRAEAGQQEARLVGGVASLARQERAVPPVRVERRAPQAAGAAGAVPARKQEVGVCNRLQQGSSDWDGALKSNPDLSVVVGRWATA